MIEQFHPIFIVGIKRSGTTLLRLMLDSHSQIAITPESQFIGYFYNNLKNYGPLKDDNNFLKLVNDITRCRRFKFRNTKVPDEKILLNSIYPRNLSNIINFFNTMYMFDNKKKIWGDKTPIFHRHVDRLVDLFPSCKIICIIRDPSPSFLVTDT